MVVVGRKIARDSFGMSAQLRQSTYLRTRWYIQYSHLCREHGYAHSGRDHVLVGMFRVSISSASPLHHSPIEIYNGCRRNRRLSVMETQSSQGPRENIRSIQRSLASFADGLVLLLSASRLFSSQVVICSITCYCNANLTSSSGIDFQTGPTSLILHE